MELMNQRSVGPSSASGLAGFVARGLDRVVAEADAAGVQLVDDVGHRGAPSPVGLHPFGDARLLLG